MQLIFICLYYYYPDGCILFIDNIAKLKKIKKWLYEKRKIEGGNE